jgi:hypothetical protein
MTTPTNPERSGPRLRLERITGQGPEIPELGAHDSPITIGRKEGENQIVLKDEQNTVSRRHAEIKPTGDGFRIFDLKSRNGVQVQGRAVPAGGTVLSDGDEVKLGLTVLRVRIVVPPPAAAADDDRTIHEMVPPTPAERRPSPPPAPPAEPPRHARETPRPPRADPPMGARAVEPPAKPREPAPRQPAASSPPPREDLDVVDRFGPFAIHRRLHQSSGLALEYATDTRQRRRVLVRRWQKLKLGFFAKGRFQRAYKAASAVRHETVLAPIEVGSADGDTYVSYPGVDGVTAGMIIRVGGRDLRIDLAVYVALEACRAVEALAKAGGAEIGPVVTDHDVIVGRDGTVRLLYVPDGGGLADEARYAAPEEDAGGTRDARSAIFSLGILLYELLVREPIAASQKLTLPSVDTRRIQVGSELAAAVMRAVEVRPHERFAHAGDLAVLLAQVLDQLTPDFRPEQVASWVASRFAQ